LAEWVCDGLGLGFQDVTEETLQFLQELRKVCGCQMSEQAVVANSLSVIFVCVDCDDPSIAIFFSVYSCPTRFGSLWLLTGVFRLVLF